MMRNPKETIGKMIDKVKVSFISYMDDGGYPVKGNVKA
ncbi:pyridoxamine 5'-phosphate oxidase-related FMN-binding-protein [Firmicutes bacterium CAG:631]|nr:pyridoxamine 5'-phosphate oxidase-related FMN-binding-protein [Firmicutes bacterium CAG:631]